LRVGDFGADGSGMKRFVIFLFLAPVSGSLVTMLFDLQMNLLPGPPRRGIVSFGISFFFGYIAGIVPALVLAVADWALARNAMRVGIVAGVAFAFACLCTFQVFDWLWILAAGCSAAIPIAVCSWLSGGRNDSRVPGDPK
jgi:hypothetical protein